MADLSPDSIPQEMRDERRWVIWRYANRNGKRTKVPMNPSTTFFAKVNDSSTWSDFATAMKAYETGWGDGVGFVLGDGWAGIDLDHVRTDGKLSDAAQAIVDAAGTYTEISPSGSGVHMIVKDSSKYSAPNVGAIDGGSMEIYNSGRYFTVTGDSIGSSSVSVDGGTLQAISDEYMTHGIAAAVSQSVYGHVSRAANNTMMRNSIRDNVRWARVPTGKTTCAFCMLLASRGFIYHSEQTAIFKSLMGKYHDKCFVGDTNVAGPDISRTIRRHYKGPLVNIGTATGRELSVTPNHPILTDKGWVKAGLLDIGSRLACRSDCDSHICGVPDKKHGNIHIEDIFSSSRVLYASRFGIMPRTTEYFDSDGRTEEIDVVDTDGFFVDKRKTALRSKRVKPRFAFGHFLDPGCGFLLNRMHACDLCLNCLMASSHGVMSGCDLCHTAFRCHRMGTDYTCFASAPTFYPGFIKPSRYRRSGDADPSGNGVNGFSGYESLDDSIWARNLVAFGLDAGSFNDFVTSAPVDSGARGNIPDGLAGSISFDDIVSYGVSEFCGHVYNLTTEGNWYLANGIIAHNCDCRAVSCFDDDPSLDGYDPDGMYDQYNEAVKQIPDSQTRASWKTLTEDEQKAYGKKTRGGSDAYNNYRLHMVTAQMREMYGLS